MFRKNMELHLQSRRVRVKELAGLCFPSNGLYDVIKSRIVFDQKKICQHNWTPSRISARDLQNTKQKCYQTKHQFLSFCN
jgi:hypothetical protein